MFILRPLVRSWFEGTFLDAVDTTSKLHAGDDKHCDGGRVKLVTLHRFWDLYVPTVAASLDGTCPLPNQAAVYDGLTVFANPAGSPYFGTENQQKVRL